MMVSKLFKRFDLLITPTLATSAFPIGKRPKEINGREVNEYWGFTPFTFPFNMSGNPAASVPCGFTEDSLPVGLHIVGRKGEESKVLAASAVFERLRPWSSHRPPGY